MSSAELREFDRQLRSEIRISLSRQGFSHGQGRTFRRLVEHEGTCSTQIIEFQVGAKSRYFGLFTVNLALFNPEYLPEPGQKPEHEPQSWDCYLDLVQRLGFFRTPTRGLIDRVMGRRPEPSDHWWCQSGNPSIMQTELAEVMNLLLSHGLNWL